MTSSKPRSRSDRCAYVRVLKRAALTWLIVALAVCGLSLMSGCSSFCRKASGQQGQTRPRISGSPTPAPENGSAGTINNNKMSEAGKESKPGPIKFYDALDGALAKRGLTSAQVCDPSDPVARRVLEDYGAMFVASETVMPPPVCMFVTEAEVTKFQAAAKFQPAVIAGDRIELQPAAMEALIAARKEAREAGLDITPRGGTEAARRNYGDTRRLWDTRFLPALAHWKQLGRLSAEQVARLRAMSLKDQVREVLELEKSGIFFSKDFSKSILYSIAAPGSSQHIAMLALDVTQFGDARVRSILARHGWFQTVKSDLPHFTFLGLREDELPSRGLRSVTVGEQLFWIPNVDGPDNVGMP